MNYGNNANGFLQDHLMNCKQSANASPNSFDKPQPISPMEGAAGELQMSLEVLAKVVEELRMRLAPVLRSGVESGSKDLDVGPRDVTSPMRDLLAACTSRVGGIRNSLQDILSRLEV